MCIARQLVMFISGMRTPLGKYGRALAGYSAIELGTSAIKAALLDAGVQPSKVQEVVMGKTKNLH